MSDKTDVRRLETHGKQLSEETTTALKQPVAEPMPEKGEPAADGFIRSAGSWKGLVDSETLIAAIYASRRI
jgi:hypothetical protein